MFRRKGGFRISSVLLPDLQGASDASSEMALKLTLITISDEFAFRFLLAPAFFRRAGGYCVCETADLAEKFSRKAFLPKNEPSFTEQSSGEKSPLPKPAETRARRYFFSEGNAGIHRFSV